MRVLWPGAATGVFHTVVKMGFYRTSVNVARGLNAKGKNWSSVEGVRAVGAQL